MKRNSLAMVVVCFTLLIFAGNTFGHHNINHKVLILGHWVDVGPAEGWFCSSEVPILHLMRLRLEDGKSPAASKALFEYYQAIPNERGEPTCNEGSFQMKPVRILALTSSQEGKTKTAIEIETEGKAVLFTVVWIPVLKPEDDPETLIVGQSAMLSEEWKVCDTKEQAEYIVAGYQESYAEGETRYRIYTARRNVRGNRVCGTKGGLANITGRYETVRVSRPERMDRHLTLFEMRIKNVPFFSWTYGAMAGPVKSNVPEIGI